MKIGEQQIFAISRLEGMLDALKTKRVRMENIGLLNHAEGFLRMAIESGDKKNWLPGKEKR